MSQTKKYKVEVQGADGEWHRDSEHSTRARAERRHRDLCSSGYSPIRVLTPGGKVCNESKVISVQ